MMRGAAEACRAFYSWLLDHQLVLRRQDAVLTLLQLLLLLLVVVPLLLVTMHLLVSRSEADSIRIGVAYHAPRAAQTQAAHCSAS
jgi:hypothetical protein